MKYCMYFMLSVFFKWNIVCTSCFQCLYVSIFTWQSHTSSIILNYVLSFMHRVQCITYRNKFIKCYFIFNSSIQIKAHYLLFSWRYFSFPSVWCLEYYFILWKLSDFTSAAVYDEIVFYDNNDFSFFTNLKAELSIPEEMCWGRAHNSCPATLEWQHSENGPRESSAECCFAGLHNEPVRRGQRGLQRQHEKING